MELTYSNMDGYRVPNLTMPQEQPVGKYGMMRLAHLKENRPAMYEELVLTTRLNAHLREIDRQAGELVQVSIQQMMAEQNSPNKETDPMGWTGWMNSLKLAAEEQVTRNLIYV